MSCAFSTSALIDDCTSNFKGIDYPCSVASGIIPDPNSPLPLPAFSIGNYELCATFQDVAHYCYAIVYGPLIIYDEQTFKSANLGDSFVLGICTSKSCSAEALAYQLTEREYFQEKIASAASWIILNHETDNRSLAIAEATKRFKTNTHVKCYDPEIDDKHIPMDFAVCFFLFFTLCFLFAVVFSSWYEILHLRRHDDDNAKFVNIPPRNVKERFILQFSAFQNFNKLVTPQSSSGEGVFDCLNGIRVLSIMWVVSGHESGNIIDFPFLTNPTKRDSMAQSVGIGYIQSGWFAVDTFFFLSGFLAAIGFIEELIKKNRAFSIRFYFESVFSRMIRLMPCVLWTILFWWKILPYNVNGPFVNHTENPVCKEAWWATLFFINDFATKAHHGLDVCMFPSWYLSNDMQFFLLCPFFVQLYKLASQRNTQLVPWRRWVEIYSPSCIMIVSQILVTLFITEQRKLRGFFDSDTHLYSVPYIRWTPYFVGIILAFVYDSRIKDYPNDWKKPLFFQSAWFDFVLFLFSVLILFSSGFVFYSRFFCKDGKDCMIWWSSRSFYGIYKSENWGNNRFLIDSWSSLKFLAWSSALAYIAYYFFRGKGRSINRALSRTFWTPFARLSFNVYLLHVMVMDTFYKSILNSSRSTSWSLFAMHTLAMIVWSFAASFILYIVIEKPSMNLLALMFSSKRKHVMETAENLENRVTRVADIERESIMYAESLMQNDDVLDDDLIEELQLPLNDAQSIT